MPTQNNLTTALLRNRDGQFVAPTMAAFQAAAANADWSKVQHFAIDLNDQPGAESWPIESATFVLLPTDPKDANQSVAVKKFFDWGFAHGNDIATQLLYIPLPDSVHDAIRAAWKAEVPGTDVSTGVGSRPNRRGGADPGVPAAPMGDVS